MNLAVRLHLIAGAFWRLGFIGRMLSKAVYWISRMATLADIDPRATVDPTVLIPHGSGVVIGETATIGPGTVIMPGVVIGARDWSEYKRHADVGAGVFLGAGAKVLGAVRIGDRARVGANSVVLSDVAPDSTVVGAPARCVKNRTPGHRDA